MRRRPMPVVVATSLCLTVGAVSMSSLDTAAVAGADPAKTIATLTPTMPATTLAPAVPPTTPPSTAPTTMPATVAPTMPATAPTVAPATAAPPPVVGIAEVVDVGDAKPPRFYDDYLAASLADIQNWWATEYARLFGEPYAPLAGGIFAAYPERTSPIPSCGGEAPNTSYQEVNDYGAFYCPLGDFMAYDDGEQGILFELADNFGASILSVVLAHEFGHAIQFRAGDLDSNVETILTEQQADCFSGAWSRRAWDGGSPGITFTDADVRTGLIALVIVRDPVGISVFEPGGHGSAFDRIGAFQHGFIGGVDACVNLIDDPLPLLPNEFNPGNPNDELTQGNAPFGYGNDQIMGIAQNDLINFWPAELAATGATIPLIQLRPVADPANDNCGSLVDLLESGAVFCAATNEVLFLEEQARELYDQFGDFAVGYAISHAWADGIQAALGIPLQGEQRSTISDCLTGAWVAGAILPPDDFVGTTTTSPLHPGREMVVSPGDLDEAVQTALTIGDPGFNDNVKGSAFEKIAYLRIGVLEGTSRCLQEADRLAGATP